MTLLISRRVRRAGSLGAAASLFLGMLMVAGPAAAAPTITLTATPEAVTVGEPFELTWEATDAVGDLETGGDWEGARPTSGAETITPTEPGAMSFSLYGEDSAGDQGAATLVVTVYADPGEITFPDECTVVVPETVGVDYFADYGDGDEPELLAPDTYTDGYFYNGGDSVTITAESRVDFAPGATTSWTFTQDVECDGLSQGPELVTAVAGCRDVTFTNVTGVTQYLVYFDIEAFEDSEDVEDVEIFELTLAPGQSVTRDADFTDLLYGVDPDPDWFEDESGPTSVRPVFVPRDCVPDGAGSGDVSDGEDTAGDADADHPTVAPAAGA
jgi:hypothetical protein